MRYSTEYLFDLRSFLGGGLFCIPPPWLLLLGASPRVASVPPLGTSPRCAGLHLRCRLIRLTTVGGFDKSPAPRGFYLGRAFRDIYLLTACADESEDELHHVTSGLEGWIACFEKARLAGVLHATANTEPGDIEHHNSRQLTAARALGAAV